MSRFQSLLAAVVSAPSRIGFRTLIVLAAALHLVTTSIVFLVGRFSLMPSQFDSNGLGAFGWDSYRYQLMVISMAEKLTGEGITAWLLTPAPLHAKFYSLSHALLGKWIGFSILSVEPVNLAFYIVILFLVYCLTKAIFSQRAALLALALTAVWPTFLMHTTQVLKDPLLITIIMAFILSLTLMLTESYSWKRGLLAGGGAALLILGIWIVRVAMWDFALTVVFVGVILLVVRQVRDKRVLGGNIIVLIALLATVLITPRYAAALQDQEKKGGALVEHLAIKQPEAAPMWARITKARHGFLSNGDELEHSTGSNIDDKAEFHSWWDVARYVPRAIEIGLFAPFPRMWVSQGERVGLVGRLISGGETILIYLFYLVALFAVYRRRREPAIWLLAFTVVAGVAALGLMIPNIGMLYRIRLPFWAILIVLAAGGFESFYGKAEERPRTANATVG